jgi:16S rRNA (cytidine1402-2'-O)-methyltransferase
MLYIVATPIGNLEDITLRAIRTLKEVNFVLSEDTRVTSKLLKHFDIDTPSISFHEYSDDNKYEKILALLEKGQDLALVTDAGTPGISDPGSFLVKTVKEKLPEISIVPIPGPSALASAISVSGLNLKEFTFLGFPPHKKGRKTFFDQLIEKIENHPVIIYESTHRLLKALESIKDRSPDCNIVVCKEMTKIFEEIMTGKPQELIDYFLLNHDKIKGEFVIIVS